MHTEFSLENPKDTGVDGRVTLKKDLREIEFGSDSSGSCKHRNELLGNIKCWGLLYQPSEY